MPGYENEALWRGADWQWKTHTISHTGVGIAWTVSGSTGRCLRMFACRLTGPSIESCGSERVCALGGEGVAH